MEAQCQNFIYSIAVKAIRNQTHSFSSAAYYYHLFISRRISQHIEIKIDLDWDSAPGMWAGTTRSLALMVEVNMCKTKDLRDIACYGLTFKQCFCLCDIHFLTIYM